MNPLAYVRDTTGKIIRLGMFESVEGIRIEGNLIVLSVARAKFKPVRGGFLITKRGRILYTFRLDNRTGVWSLTDTLPVWWSTDELHAAPSRRERDTEWEELCHRPGTARTPLDNRARQQQGY